MRAERPGAGGLIVESLPHGGDFVAVQKYRAVPRDISDMLAGLEMVR
jgi:hypothetical protein